MGVFAECPGCPTPDVCNSIERCANARTAVTIEMSPAEQSRQSSVANPEPREPQTVASEDVGDLSEVLSTGAPAETIQAETVTAETEALPTESPSEGSGA
jgi:hypothetical protein